MNKKFLWIVKARLSDPWETSFHDTLERVSPPTCIMQQYPYSETAEDHPFDKSAPLHVRSDVHACSIVFHQTSTRKLTKSNALNIKEKPGSAFYNEAIKCNEAIIQKLWSERSCSTRILICNIKSKYFCAGTILHKTSAVYHELHIKLTSLQAKPIYFRITTTKMRQQYRRNARKNSFIS